MRNMQQIFMPNGNTGQKVAFLAASAVDSGAISNQCYAIELYATQDVYISVDEAVDKAGSTAGAVTSGLSYYLPASTTRKIAVAGGTILKVQGESADGSLYINELTA